MMQRVDHVDLHTLVEADDTWGMDLRSYVTREDGTVHVVWERYHAGGKAYHSVTIKHEDIPVFVQRLLAAYIETEKKLRKADQ